MLESYFEAPNVLERLRFGTTGSLIDGFAVSLHASGYARVTTRNRLRGAAHLCRWLERRGISLASLDESTVHRFARHLPSCRCQRRHPGQHGALRLGASLFLAYLRQQGIAPSRLEKQPCLPPVIDAFRSWMRLHRGVTEITLNGYERMLTEFVAKLGADPKRYDAAKVRGFMLEHAKDVGRSQVQNTASALRMYLRYLSVDGQCLPDLIASVPKVAHWRLSTLPRYLPAESVERIIAACDLRTSVGKRDRAILLLLARLGLRAADVGGLHLADVDWRRGRVRVIGKGRRETWLPLPQDVGDAILAYLKSGRPSSKDDHVFMTVVAPVRALHSQTAAISQLVRRAIEKTGIEAPSYGAHLLRHSAATTLLRRGATLDTIGALLRQRSMDVTALYAKVDVLTLRRMAQPWPDKEVLLC
jgi:integrase/recombinase XerD